MEIPVAPIRFPETKPTSVTKQNSLCISHSFLNHSPVLHPKVYPRKCPFGNEHSHFCCEAEEFIIMSHRKQTMDAMSHWLQCFHTQKGHFPITKKSSQTFSWKLRLCAKKAGVTCYWILSLQGPDTLGCSRFKGEVAVLRLDIATGNGLYLEDVICFPIPEPNAVLHYTGKTDRWDFLLLLSQLNLGVI